METEKKYLVPNVPDIENATETDIEQHYLAVTENREVRIRHKSGGGFMQEVKIGKGENRRDPGTEITRKQYEDLKRGSMGSVHKTRTEIRWNGLLIELDTYRRELEGLSTAEIEFDNGVPDDFEPPEWFGCEVTEIESFKNKWLATNGLPDGFVL